MHESRVSTLSSEASFVRARTLLRHPLAGPDRGALLSCQAGYQGGGYLEAL